MDGVISQRPVAPGVLVSPQTPLVTLVPPALESAVDVEESQLSQLDEGQAVQIQVGAYPGRTFAGSITSISPTVDARSRTTTVRIEPSDESHQFRAGMYANVSIVTKAHEAVLLIPKRALLPSRDGSQPVVFTLLDGNDKGCAAHRA